jgi:two-component system, NarL family, sensor kinase
MESQNNQIKVFILVTILLIVILIGFVVIMIFNYKRKQISYLNSISTIKTDYEKNLLTTQLEIQEQTLQNISREIHDNISISLTLAKLQLNILDIQNPDAVQQTVLSSVDLISKSISELSHLSKSFNTEAILENGLYNTLKQEIEKIKRTGIHQVVFNVTGTPVFMASQKELILFRIAQEALNNILKHADASKITVSLCYEPQLLVLGVADNGKGFDLNGIAEERKNKMKAGLSNIQLRSATINGDCTINSTPGKGTIIYVSTPYDKNDNFGKEILTKLGLEAH